MAGQDKVYCVGPVGRVLYTGVILFGAAGVLTHFINLFHEPPEHISWGLHVGASLFVMGISAGISYLGFAGLLTRMEVNAVGLRSGPRWFGMELELTWDAVERWTIRLEIETTMVSDEQGNSWPSVTRREFLEVVVRARPGPVRWSVGAKFYKEIVAELRSRLPGREDVLCSVIHKKS